jgi:hypothetical protein
LGLAWPDPVQTQAPARVTIVPDGAFSDWEQVLTNPLNSARDADGHSVGCAFSPDRDCIVGGREHDLARFAWTWSGTDWAFYVERFGNSGGWEWFWVYLDTNLDGAMETGEPVLRLRLNGDGVDNELAKFNYVSAVAGVPDPMIDVQGFADGHHQQGTEAGPEIPLSVDLGANADGKRYEGLVSSAFLGVPSGGPMRFHVASSSNNNLPNSIEDNMGGEGGGIGTTEYRIVTAGPDSESSSGPGLTHLAPVTLCNGGNLPSRLNFSVQSASGYDLTFHQDLDGTGFPAVYLGFDDGGDGDMTRSRDDLSAEGDRDANQVLDTGVLAAGECFLLLIGEEFPNNSNGTRESLFVSAWQDEDGSVAAEARLDIWLGMLTLLPEHRLLVRDGETAWFPHVLTNNTPTAERVDLRAVSARGWTTGSWFDPNADGLPDDAVPLLDSDGSGLPDLLIPSRSSVSIFASVLLPLGTPAGQADAVTVDALVSGNARATATNRAEAVLPLSLEPNHLLSEGDERYGAAGRPVYFAHRIRNGLGVTDTVSLQAVSDSGWATVLLDDPDGDGRPFDSMPLDPPELSIAGGGGERSFLVRVDVPGGSSTGTVSRIDVIATSQTDPGIAAAAADDAIAAIVIAYQDANYEVSARSFSPCSTVHARAQGLPPSTGGFRFAWRDAGGSLVQSVSATTDAAGTCASSRQLLQADSGSGWSVTIDQWDAPGGVWLTQDTAPFGVEGAVTVDELSTNLSTYHLTGVALSGTADVTNTGLVDANDVLLRWVVLDEAAGQYLRSNGTFAAYTGSEATEMDQISRVQPGQTKVRSFAIASVSFPAPGTYSVELHAAASCGGETLAGSVTFEVVDDQDLDGLSLAEELLAGTDPTDADSDDDHVLDGLDGVTDSDMDGVIDALDCDSDDDGLLDGVESGAWWRHDDTASSSSCDAFDLWPGTVTDPDDADTDSGGVSDGVEDTNGNGRLDPGEGDPLDPADDGTIDTDADGVPDLDEFVEGTDADDADSDDDGLSDGAERGRDSDGDGVVDGLECDSDGDGLADGLEAGLSSPTSDTDLGAGCFAADADPTTTTDPTRADTDGAGVPDGAEDLDRDGALDPDETDPGDPADDDSDLDGLPNLDEDARGTARLDRDSDDDGIPDGLEPDADSDGDGLADALECDSDGDGLPDGLEAGLSAADPDTDLGAACFRADVDPGSTTDPTNPDSDGAGVADGAEDLNANGRLDPGETDATEPSDDDSDLDGLPNLAEDLVGTDRTDRDSDDDGLIDGLEASADSDGDGLADALDCDSDDDGLPDGLELGLILPGPDTDLGAGCWVADADPGSTTDPASADSDGAGVADGMEDANSNGRVDAGETDPQRADDDDSDLDGLPNLQEDLRSTDRFDRDSDDDGLLDGDEAARDSDGDGLTDALECDADGDGLNDGLERGLVAPDDDTDLSAGCFAADADPATTTDPTAADSDGGGVIDGLEDADGNGRVDAGERDPALAFDDSCSTEQLPEITDLLVVRLAGAAVRLTWTAQGDACATYTAWSWGDQIERPELASGLTEALADDPGVFRPGAVVYYQVAAVSSVSGVGAGAP